MQDRPDRVNTQSEAMRAEKPTVLFVCTANVCRSPTAHGIFLDMAARLDLRDSILVDSAGTNASTHAKAPETRATKFAAREGYDLSGLLSRPLEAEDFQNFRYIVCMDSSHLEKVNDRKPNDFNGEISLLLQYAENLDVTEVPDPYFGGNSEFKRALRLIEDGCYALMDHIVHRHF